MKFWYPSGMFVKATNSNGFCEKDINGSYKPDKGETGAWSAQPQQEADAITGMGMPWNWHVSLVCVWKWIK